MSKKDLRLRHVAFVADPKSKEPSQTLRQLHGVVTALEKHKVREITIVNLAEAMGEQAFYAELESIITKMQCSQWDVRFFGALDHLSPDKRILIDRLASYDADRVVWFGLKYSGRAEIARSLKRALAENLESPITEEKLEHYLDATFENAIDAAVFLNSRHRLHDSLLWQLSYSEVLFERKAFSQLDCECVEALIREYAHREQRFGR